MRVGETDDFARVKISFGPVDVGEHAAKAKTHARRSRRLMIFFIFCRVPLSDIGVDILSYNHYTFFTKKSQEKTPEM